MRWNALALTARKFVREFSESSGDNDLGQHQIDLVSSATDW